MKVLHINTIKFTNYKCFSIFSMPLAEFNILVGPNNAGKSTIIGALKILSEGIRKARARKAILIDGPEGHQIYGYSIDLNNVPIAIENVFHNYDDDTPAIVRFRLSDGAHLQIFFPSQGVCYFNYESEFRVIKSPKDFMEHVNIEIGYVPILGPVEHTEKLYQKEAARNALLTHTASRNFRNIWYHYQNDFDEFRTLVQTTWPGMDIEAPEVDNSGKDPILHMFCPEERIPREIFWAGFGFQVWCQMLTYIIKNRKASIFLIDEPDIYLHSDLQRQLLNILKSLGPDIVLATHSTELISEAESNDILLINKVNKIASRIKNPDQLSLIFHVLGSNLNPVLTQIAKTKKVLFVEGKDFTIISKIARLLKVNSVANRAGFAVIPLDGFNLPKLAAFREGTEKTIGSKILTAVILDRDYRSKKEIEDILDSILNDNYFAHIHSKKEIENYLLIPEAVEKSIQRRLGERRKRTGQSTDFNENIISMLSTLSEKFKHSTYAQLQSNQLKYKKLNQPNLDESTIIKEILRDFELEWDDIDKRLSQISGKEFLSELNNYLQKKYQITVSSTNIISEFTYSIIPEEMQALIAKIDAFSEVKLA